MEVDTRRRVDMARDNISCKLASAGWMLYVLSILLLLLETILHGMEIVENGGMGPVDDITRYALICAMLAVISWLTGFIISS